MGDAVAAASLPAVRVRRTMGPYGMACISGVLLALSFPRFGWPPLAWIALAPLLIALARVPRWGAVRRGFTLGLTTGVVYFAGTVYWTSGVMAQYGGLSLPVSIAIAGLLVAFLALYPALFGAVMARLVRWLGARALLMAPAVWVATELGRTVIFGGFPWALVGYSQTSVLPVAQLAAITGVYGVSALVVLISGTLAYATVHHGRSGYVAIGGALALVAVVSIWGAARLADNRLTREGTDVPVGLIQGNVPQDQKWDAELEDRILDKYLRLSRQAAAQGVRLILWPESAVPFYFEDNPKGLAIRALARQLHTWLLIGSDQLERGVPPAYYNAAFMVRPDGTTAGVYRKVHLVPFGEYVPAKRLLFFAAPLVEAVSDFAPGESVVTLPFDHAPISTAICYEVVYPRLIRDGTLMGSQLLTTITNDAWFGRSSAPYQHFEMAAMRAIEQGRYMARAANTGISGFVDPYGRVLAASDLFTDRVLVGHVRLLTGRTVYAEIGDAVAYACVLITVVALVGAGAFRVRRS